MTEEHVMDVRWSGDHDVAMALKAAATPHGCSVEVEQDGHATTVIMTLRDADLQQLRDRVDALLVDLSDVEENQNR